MRSIRIWLILITIAGSSSGCVGSQKKPENEVFSTSEIADPFLPEAILVDPKKVKSITLDELLVFADTHAPSIKTYLANRELYTATRIGVDTLFQNDPELSISVGTRLSGEKSGVDFGASLNQKFEIAGQGKARLEAAKDDERLAEATLNAQRWALHVIVHRLFVDLLLVRERLKQATEFVVFSKSLREIASRQVEIGESSPLILLVADADLAQTFESLIEAEKMESSLLLGLATLIGWPTSKLPEIVGHLPILSPIPNEEELLQMMATHHPSLRVREIAVQAGLSKVELRDKEAWSDLALGLSYAQESSLQENDPDTNILSVQFSFPLQLWKGNQAERGKANAQLWIADSQRTKEAAELKGKLLTALLAFKSSKKVKELYESNVIPNLKKNLVYLKKAFELGEVDVHQVSQTRQRLLNASAHYMNAKVLYHETAVALEGLVGTELFEENTP